MVKEENNIFTVGVTSGRSGHAHNYTEAARDGYKQITPKLAAVINQYIKQ